jgi:hypothetical protein
MLCPNHSLLYPFLQKKHRITLLLSFFVSLSADAASFPVSNLNNSGAGSLRQAILDSNSAGGTNSITFNEGLTGTIVLTSQLSISNHLSIIGPGPSTLAVSGNDVTRVFLIGVNRNVEFHGLTIRNGRTVDANENDSVTNNGAGIIHRGFSLVLSNCVLINNNADRCNGGALYSRGTNLFMSHCIVSNNTASTEHGGTSSGAGIESYGTTRIEHSVIISNVLRSLDGATIFSTTAQGAGITHRDASAGSPYDVLTLSNSVVSGNQAIGGYKGAARAGGIFSDSAIFIVNSTLSGNAAIGGSGTNSDLAGFAQAGALYFVSGGGRGVLLNSTISGNRAIGGTGNGSADGGTVEGGALLVSLTSLTNCTISGNIATGGATQGSFGGAASGGGIYFDNDTATSNYVVNCTITLNSANGVSGSGGSGTGRGGGIFREGMPLTLHSTIVAQNTTSHQGPDIHDNSGPTILGSYNLIGDGAFGDFSHGANNNQVGSSGTPLNPLLGPLQNNGGPTFTHALLGGSPAIDKGIANGNATDQRGQSRTVDDAGVANASGGDGTDIGAVEAGIVAEVGPTLSIARASANQVTVSWSPNTPGYSLQERTNLTSGTWNNSPSGSMNPASIVTTPTTKYYRLIKP